MGVGFTANSGNDKVTVALDRVFSTVGKGVDDMQYFFGMAKNPLLGVLSSVSGAVDDSDVVVDNSGFVQTGIHNIKVSLQSFDDKYSQTLIDIGAGTTISDSIASIDDSVMPMVDSVDTVLGLLTDTLVSSEESIKEAVEQGVEAIDGMNTTIDEMDGQMADMKDTNEDTSELRRMGVLGIFAVAMIFVILGLVGVFVAFTPCSCDDNLEYLLHFTWIFGTFITLLAFIIGGVALTL